MDKRLRLVSRFLVVVVLLATPALAQKAGSYEGPVWAPVDAKQALAAASEITPAKYPDSDDATVEKKMVRVYRADGTGETQDETFTKVLTEKGKRNNRTLTLSFMLPYFTNEVVKLEIIKPNGQVVPVDVEANSKVVIDDSQMAMNIYDPNSKLLQVNIPQLDVDLGKIDVGDVVHSISRLTMHRPIIPGEFAEYNVFEGPGYIRHITYEIFSPREKPLKRIFLRDEVAGTVKHTTRAGANGVTIHRWDVNNVPRMFDEPSMPPYEMVLQRLLVSTTPDWHDVSKWYWQLSKPHLDATTPDMKKMADELTAGAKTDLDKTKAIFYYVSKNIRYMGLTPEKDRPGFEPHDVSLTFGKKYGVCRDKAGLLVSLLRAAGLKAYPVLINVGTKMDPDVPEPFFNHAIVSAELKKGEYVLMDPTDENTRDLLPDYDCDQSYLVCRPEGEKIRVSPVNPPEQNMMRVRTTATLNAAGTLEAKSDLSFDGINDNSYRGMFARMKPDDKRRFFERNLKQSMPGATLKSLKLTPEDMQQDDSTPVHAEIEFSVEGAMASGSGKSVVSVPWIGKDLGVVNFILGGTGLEKRKYPLQTFVACGLQEDITVKLADDFTGAVSMPSSSPIQDACMSYQQSFSFKGRLLACSRDVKLKVVEFSPAQYLKLKKTLETLEYDGRKAPVLALAANTAADTLGALDPPPAPPVESNAKLIESDKQLDIQDAHTATYKVRYVKRILTYSGKVREAEVKIDYNPAIQEARLIKGTVISKTGQRQEISKDEMNVMDAGWNASAKRYTGGKILVANLPGVDIGSTIEVEFEITSKGKAFLSGFESFQMPDELEKKSFRLTAPENVAIQKDLSGRPGVVKEQEQTADGRQVFQWNAENVKALPAEPQLPPEWAYLAGVGYFVGDLDSYLKDLNAAMLARSEKRSQAAAMARQLIQNAKSPAEKVKAIRDFVAKSIRVAGPSFTELPLSELSDADTTLADGYGHLADRAILLHAMLSAAAFQPEFVLASSLPPIPAITNVTASFPLPHSFQIPLVRVALDDETCYLNDTDQYAHLGSTSYDGKLGLVLATGASEIIKAPHDCADKTDTHYTLSLSDSGQTRLTISRHFYGTSYNGKNRYFSELPPEERRRYFQEIVSGVAQGARPVGDLTTKFDCYPGVEEFTVDIDKYCIADGNYFYFDLPFAPSLFPSGADQRALPLFVSHQSDESIRTEITLPPGFHHVLIAPHAEDLQAPAGSGQARINFENNGGKCILTHELDTAPAIVPPADYAALLKVESTLGRKSSKLFLLQR